MHFEWAAHYNDSIDIVEEYRKREKHAIHCGRVPCLETERCKYTNVDDFWVVHLAKLNHKRVCQKIDFYQVTWLDKNTMKASPINMYRGYNRYYPDNLIHLDSPIRLCCMGDLIDCSTMVESSDYGKHYIEEMVQVFRREGTNKFLKLCIWDNPYLIEAGVTPRIPFRYRLLHSYLKRTQRRSNSKVIKLVDKVFNYLYSF